MNEKKVSEKLDAVITLLAIDKEEELEEKIEELDELHLGILSEVYNWRKASNLKPEIINDFDSSSATVERRIRDLLDEGFLMKKGSGTATEYKAKPVITQVQKLKNSIEA